MTEELGIAIMPFEPRHAQAFHDLNVAWVERHFIMEDKDREQVEQPQAMIIGKGGHILIAQNDSGTAIGCVSLVPYSDSLLELANMAVVDGLQGRGVGSKLMAATVAKARELGASAIYLESNDALGPAVRLYERTGFRHLSARERPASPYERANVFMRLVL